MSSQGTTPDYDSVCRYAGRLFLESQHAIERLHLAQAEADKASQNAIQTLREQLGAEQLKSSQLQAELRKANGRDS